MREQTLESHALGIAIATATRMDLAIDFEERLSASLVGAAQAFQWARSQTKPVTAERFSSYCVQVCKSRIYDALRSWHGRDQDKRPQLVPLDEAPAPDMDWDQVFDVSLGRTLFSKLSDEHRRQVYLWASGYTYSEIAAMQKVSKSEVYRDVNQALDRLREVCR